MATTTIPVIDIYDTTTMLVDKLPPTQQAAGYTTGVGIAWTTAQFAAHARPYPAVRIDQSLAATDPTADILDVESGAATVADVAPWLIKARESYSGNARPGQRWPGIYCTLSNLDTVIASLTAAGITSCPFAIPDLTTRADAVTKVSTATGNFPRVWQQWAFGASYDSGIVSVPWLTTVSGNPPRTQAGWRWCHKCQGLFFVPGMIASHCPAGGTHDASQSGNYIMTFG
jgi:hypothetical protein